MIKYILTILCCATLFCGAVFAQDAAPVGDVFKEKLADMSSDDANKARNGQQDWQRLCLEASAPGQEQRKAEAVRLMADALEKGGLNTSTRFWFIRQIGRLDDGTNAQLLGKFFGDTERVVRDETVGALAIIPNEKAGKTLKELLAKENDEAKKTALQNALKYRAERKAVDLPKLDAIVNVLETGSPKDWEHTLPKLAWLTDITIADIPNYKTRFDKLSPQAKILLTDALAVRGDKAVLPLAVEMSESDNEQIRLAGYRAIGLLGDASVLPLLLEKIKEGGDLGDTVRDSLARLNFDNADRLLIDTYDKANDNGVKSNLLKVYNNRKGTIATPLFEAALKSTDDGIRNDSIRSLEQVGQQSSVPALVARYFVEQKKDFRDAIERAIVQIESRYGEDDGRGKTLCGEIAKRNETEQVQLIPLLGRIGGTVVRQFVLEQYQNGKPAVREAAFRSLCNWTDASVADELYKIASSTTDTRAGVAARAYIRIVTLDGHGRNDKEKLAYVEKAMSVAKTNDDRNFLLTRLDPSRCIEVFRFAVKYVDNPETEQAACRAIVDMANDTNFHINNRKEIEPWLDKVIEKSKDNGHVERAKRYKARR